MFSRRSVLYMVGASFVAPRHARAEATQSFKDMLAKALANPSLLAGARGYREGAELETRKAGPRYIPSDVKVAPEAVELIIGCEVTSQKLYTQRYQAPTRPGGESGVTIGVGYDLGYVKPSWLQEDWGNVLSPLQLSLISSACQVHGPAADHLLTKLSGVRVDWEIALKQFTTTSLPRFTSETISILPNAADLSAKHPKSFGALVSLVYNRGPSFELLGDRYKEMRNIRLHMVHMDYPSIYQEIIDMRRLWPENDRNVGGVYIRRNLEAALFSEGLNEGGAAK